MSLLDSWNEFTSDIESPEIYITWGFYSLMAAAVQRRVWITNTNPVNGLPTHNSMFLNLFVIFVGPSGVGKGRVTSQIRAISASENNKRVIVEAKSGKVISILDAITCTPDNITFEGLFQFIAKPTVVDAMLVKFMNSKGEELNTAYCHNSVTAILEELTVMFTKNAEDVASVFCQAYDAKDLMRHTKTQGTDIIKNVCVNFIAGTTPKDFRRIIANQVLQRGFDSRAIIVYAKKKRFYRHKTELTLAKQEAFEQLVRHVNYLATKVHGEIKFTNEANDYIEELYESKRLVEHERVNHDRNLDGYYERKKWHWEKLAALTHLSNLDITQPVYDLTVSLDTVKDALTLLNKTEIEMHCAYTGAGRNELDEMSKNIVAYMGSNGTECSYKKLFLKFYSEGRKQEFDEVLNFLEMTDQIAKTAGGYRLLAQPNKDE